MYDSTYEYIISAAELITTELEVTVATQKGFLSGGSPVIGMVCVVCYGILQLQIFITFLAQSCTQRTRDIPTRTYFLVRLTS